MKGTYNIHIGAYDFGCGVDRIEITLDDTINNISKDNLKIRETRQNTDFSKSTFPVIIETYERKITDAYLSDGKGNKVEGPSRYIICELYCSPMEGSPLLFSFETQFNTYSDPYYLDITSDILDLDIEREYVSKTSDADSFNIDTFKGNDGIEYKYAYYTKESDTLVVWLHGLGEGGLENTDPYITCLANKVTSLISDKFQSIVDASVLVPQCPTYWMDIDGKMSNFNKGALISDGSSYYSDSLHELIDDYKNKVGAKKVVLTGCSNGGFMTMLMALQYPDDYDAIVPICEALPDQFISDEELSNLLRTPMFFIYSNDDPIVDPDIHERPTLKRLKELGALNLTVSTSDSVIDTSNTYKDEEGHPFRYNGHWSWIYFFNNETNPPVFEWINKQLRG